MIYDEGTLGFETAPDGARIRYGHWTPSGTPRGRILLCHGRTEFLEKYRETIGELVSRGFEIWSMDWRGQGLSERMLANPHKGHIDDFESYLSDLQWFADRIAGPTEGKTFLMAHSMGGHIATRAVLEARIKPAGLILTAPMIDLPMRSVSRYTAAALARVMTSTGMGGRYIFGAGNYDAAQESFEDNPLTGDKKRFDAIHTAIAATPGVAMGGATFGWLDAAFRSICTLRTLIAAASPGCPVLLFTALADSVVSVPAQDHLAAELPGCEQIRITDARHEILHETDAVRDRFWDVFDRFTATN